MSRRPQNPTASANSSVMDCTDIEHIAQSTDTVFTILMTSDMRQQATDCVGLVSIHTSGLFEGASCWLLAGCF